MNGLDFVMAIPINPIVSAIPPSGIRRFFDIAEQDKSVISMSVGEPDFPAPPLVREAMIQSLKDEETHYTSNQGTLALRQEIAQWVKAKYGVSYHGESEVLVTVGVSEAFDLCMRGCLAPGNEVIVPKPCFVMYEPLVSFTGATVKTLWTKPENGYCVTPEELIAAITDKTRMVIFNYPCNPTGATYTRQQLEALSTILVDRDLVAVSDEIYSELSYEEPHTCLASLDGMRERTLLLNGFSKFFAMTGVRMGYLCAPAETLSHLAKIHQYGIMCAPTQSQVGALTALRECDADVAVMKDAFHKRRDVLVAGLRALGFDCPMPAGAFYVYPSVAPFGLDGETFCTRAIEEAKVALVPGHAFGSRYKDRIRISYGAGMETIQETLSRLKPFVAGLK